MVPAIILDRTEGNLRGHIGHDFETTGNFSQIIVTTAQDGNVVEAESGLDASLEEQRRGAKVVNSFLANIQSFM